MFRYYEVLDEKGRRERGELPAGLAAAAGGPRRGLGRPAAPDARALRDARAAGALAPRRLPRVRCCVLMLFC